MRLELAGSLIHPEPSVIKFDASGSFDTLSYIDLGYTHFEVICIGGGGGMGGSIDTQNTGTQIRNYGGAGGGGGFHRVRGLLSALPASCPIVIGAAGSPGIDHPNDPSITTHGGDGGYSTFNNNTCSASGGKGGRRAQSNSDTVRTLADGGDGGIGNRTIPGGGAVGGIAGIPSPTGPGTPGVAGVDGTIFNNIGKGGGGGAGGVGKYGGITCNPATAGGRGSYNPGDTSVYGPGDPPYSDPISGASNIAPGKASGAKASPINGLPTVYGRSGAPGTVVIYLTADVVITPPAVEPPPEGISFGRVRMPLIFSTAVSAQPIVLTGAYGSGLYSVGVYPGISMSYGQIDRPFTFGSVVSGIGSAPVPKQTPVAEISLASHGNPSARTTHSITIRARTLSGLTGVIKVALYEGTTNRSGDLTTPVLSNTLTDYTLAIPNAAAAAITSYSNLSIRIWGYNSAGTALVFEVARLYLTLPAVSVTPKQTPIAEISLASHVAPSVRNRHSLIIRARAQTGAATVLKAALYEGGTNRSGDLTSVVLTNALADYNLPISDASAAAITSYANLSVKFWGYNFAGVAVVMEVARVSLRLPSS